eukprot:207294-Amphidinium_carterae.2
MAGPFLWLRLELRWLHMLAETSSSWCQLPRSILGFRGKVVQVLLQTKPASTKRKRVTPSPFSSLQCQDHADMPHHAGVPERVAMTNN